MKRLVAAASPSKCLTPVCFSFAERLSRQFAWCFFGLFDDWRQGSVATSMRRSDVSSSNARAARFRTVVGSPNSGFRRRSRAPVAWRARGQARQGDGRFAVAGLLESALVPRAVGLPGAAGVLVALLSGCALGPDYVRPNAVASADFGGEGVRTKDFKERKGWKPMAPSDLADRGAWWTIYREPELDRLVAQVEISNQTVAAAEANYRQASEMIREGQAGLFPTVTSNYSAAGTHSASGGSTVYWFFLQRFDRQRLLHRRLLVVLHQQPHLQLELHRGAERHLGRGRLGPHPPHRRSRRRVGAG